MPLRIAWYKKTECIASRIVSSPRNEKDKFDSPPDTYVHVHKHMYVYTHNTLSLSLSLSHTHTHTHTRTHLAARAQFFDLLGGIDEVNAIVVVLLEARADSQDVEVEDYIHRVEPDFRADH
jgi:hypothetical protein